MRLLPNLALFVAYFTSVISQQAFLSFEPLPAPLIEWDQTNTTYYTGQTISMNWTSQNFLSTDLARIQYPGAGGTRTLTTGSGTSIASGIYSVRLSDSSNGVATNVPLTIALSTNTAISRSSAGEITVIQSKLQSIVAMDGTKILGGSQNTVCDDRNLTVMWRGLGEAQFGTVSILLRRQGGFFGTQTLATVSNLPVYGNTTVTIICPRGTTPSTSNTYAFQLTVNEPGGTDYTGNSPSFNVAVAATPTPSPSSTPTSSMTPSISATPTLSVTSSPSFSQTPTPSVSVSNTPTPSVTSSITVTPSTTETANPSIDYAAIARAAAQQLDTTPTIAGAIGGIVGLLILLGLGKWYQIKKMTEKRKKKLGQSARFMREAHHAYGIPTGMDINQEPSIIMYSVQGLPPKKQTQNSKQLDTYKTNRH